MRGRGLSPQGFEGATCENDARACGSRRCLNGGTCISGPRSPTCLCLGAFTGPECQFPAGSPCVGGNPCYNQGSCEPTAESPFYRCLCPAKFNGLLCHILDYSFGGGLGLDIPPPQIEEACALPECREEAGNKVCSLACNNHACGWDGGDCSLNFNDPWQNCSQSLQCWKYFSNGRCDSQCSSAGRAGHTGGCRWWAGPRLDCPRPVPHARSPLQDAAVSPSSMAAKAGPARTGAPALWPPTLPAGSSASAQR